MALLDLENVSHSYGSFQALRDVSLRLEPGGIGLVGQNGAGKSTLLKILLGLQPPTAGTVRVLGEELTKRFGSAAHLRMRIGYMPEGEVSVPGLRGVEFVALAGELSGLPTRQAQRRAHEVLSYLGLEEARYRKHEEYSVGMKQRLKLASALVHDPELLLLDEPTAGLDPEGREAMLNLLRSLAERHGKSLILSTHLLGDIDRVCDSVIILDRGAVVRAGRIEELRSQFRGRFRLSWLGTPDSFLAELQDRRLEVTRTRPDEAVVSAPTDWPTNAFFTIAQERGVVLRRLEPVEEDLASLYHRLT